MRPVAIRRIVSVFLSMALALLPATAGASTAFPYGTSGTGVRNGSIILYSAGDLAALSQRVAGGDTLAASGNYILGNAANLSGLSWVPIGTAAHPFTGSFDGGGHAVTGMSVSGNGEALGFFGALKNAAIANLILTGVSVHGDAPGQFIGGIAGTLKDSRISGCYVSGILAGTEGSYVGGITGNAEALSSGVEITRCASLGSVSGGAAGGLVGHASAMGGSVALTVSYSSADVSASGSDAAAGGLAGWMEGSGGDIIISDCYALGQVTARDSGAAGGIAGYLSADAGGTVSIAYCYATGAVEAVGDPYTSCAGGIAGYLDNEDSISLTGNYAVNESVSAPLLHGRVVGDFTYEDYICKGNLQIDNLLGEDAETVTKAALRLAASWGALTSRPEWAIMADGRLPILNGAPGDQRGALPLHLSEEQDGYTGISDAGQLARLAQLVNQGGPEASGNYRLTSDLDLSGLAWTPVGTASSPFTGNFDGGDHVITGLSVVDGWDYGGLFGYVRGGSISGLALRDCEINGRLYAGAFAGFLESGDISGCTSSGTVASAEGNAGGIAGAASGTARFSACSFTGLVTGDGAAGGIIGNLSGSLNDCHSAGIIRGGADAGGIAGIAGGNISVSYSITTVEGGASSGGIAGRMTSGTIENVRFLGFRTTGVDAGRIVGVMSGGSISSAQAWDGVLAGGSAVSDSQNHGTGIPARRTMSADFWLGFNSPFWLAETGSLPVLSGPELLSGELPSYLWDYPEDGEAFGISAPGGNEFPVSSQDRLIPFWVNYSRWLNPAPSVIWSLDSLQAGGPALIPDVLDNSRTSLYIPAGWSGSVTILAALKDWTGAETSITVYVNGELGQAGARISINRDAVRYLDEPGLSFTPPSPRPAGLITYTWLVDGNPAGNGLTLHLTEPGWIGKSVRVRAESENYGDAVESAALIIGKALFSGMPTEPAVESKGHGSVVLTPIQGYEYACLPAGASFLPHEADIWQSNTFTGLIAGEAYDFYQRVAETETTEPSPASGKLTVRLNADAPPIVNPDPPPDPDPIPNTPPDPDPVPDPNPDPPPDPDPAPDPDPEPDPDSDPTPNPQPDHTPAGIIYYAPATPSRGGNSSASTVGNTRLIPPSGPTPVSEIQAVSAVRAAVFAAKASGSATAVARLRNPGLISLRAMQAMAAAAKMPLRVHADSLSSDGKRVDVRITFDPSNATKSLNLAASTASPRAKTMMERFGMSTISFSQKASFGMAVDVAVGLELPETPLNRLAFRSYRSGVSQYRIIRDPLPQLDSKGYLHFRTEYAGDVAVFSVPE